MRTLSAKPVKGREEPLRLWGHVRLLATIARMALDYLVRGRRIRHAFYARQGAGEKLYVDEA